jgi:hypothetical protein
MVWPDHTSNLGYIPHQFWILDCNSDGTDRIMEAVVSYSGEETGRLRGREAAG